MGPEEIRFFYDEGVLHAVWGPSSKTFYVVGDEGTILSFDRGTRRQLDSPVSQPLVDIQGFSENQVFAISNRGTIIQFGGHSWRVHRSPAACLAAIGGRPQAGVFSVGCFGAVLHLPGPTARR